MTDDDPDVINLDKAKARRGKWQNDCIKGTRRKTVADHRQCIAGTATGWRAAGCLRL